MFESESPEQGGVSSWGVPARTERYVRAGRRVLQFATTGGHASAAEVFKYAICQLPVFSSGKTEPK